MYNKIYKEANKYGMNVIGKSYSINKSIQYAKKKKNYCKQSTKKRVNHCDLVYYSKDFLSFIGTYLCIVSKAYILRCY